MNEEEFWSIAKDLVDEDFLAQFGTSIPEAAEPLLQSGQSKHEIASKFSSQMRPIEVTQMEGGAGLDIRVDQAQIAQIIEEALGNLQVSGSNEDGTSDMPVGDVFEMPSSTHPTNAGTTDDGEKVRFQQEASRRAMANDEKQARIDNLREQLEGIKLTADQKRIVADIEANIMDHGPEFLDSVAAHFSNYSWDPGSSWDLVEADGTAKLIRKETRDEGPELSPKHAYQEGQRLMVHSTVMPEEVIVRVLKEDGQYQVQSELTGRIFVASENDLYDENQDSDLFDGEFPVNLGRLFS